MRSKPSSTRSQVCLAALLPALFACGLHWPAVWGDRLSDELSLAGYVADVTANGTHPAWHRIAEGFLGPWAFGGGDYYRPLVTASLVLDQWLGDGAAAMLHITSIVWFAVAVLATALWIAAMFGAWPAFVGGMVLAVHPAAHEPICWPCTRADFFALAGTSLALASFVRHLRGAPGRHLLHTNVATAFALLGKECAATLPAMLLLLDLVCRGWSVPWRERCRAHAGIFAVVIGYLLWRRFVLGGAFSSNMSLFRGDMALAIADKLRLVVLPSGDCLPATAPWTAALLYGASAVGCCWRGPGWRWLLAACGLAVLALVPVWQLPIGDNFERSRYLLGSVIGLVVVVATAASAPVRSWRWIGAALLALVVVDQSLGVRALHVAYERSWQRMRELRLQFPAATRDASVERPAVMLSGLPVDDGVPFLPSLQVFALARPPLAAAETPFVNLGLSIERGFGPDLLEGDVVAWRAMWQHGARLSYLLPGPRYVLAVPGPDDRPLPRIARDRGVFVVQGGPASPWPIGGVEVVADAPFARGDLWWSSPLGQGSRIPFAAGVATAEGFAASVDLTHDGGFVVFGTLAGITSLHVQIDGGSDAPVRELRFLPLARPAPLRQPLRGAEMALSESMSRLPWHSLPSAAEPDSVAVVMMNGAFAWRLQRRTDGSVALPPTGRGLLRDYEVVVARDRVYYFLQCRVDGRAWRSEVDWFERILR